MKLFGWLAGITGLVLIYTGAVTQIQKRNSKVSSDDKQQVETIRSNNSFDSTVAGNEDSVEVIGTPTGDDPWKEVTQLVSAYYSKTGMSYKGTINVIDDNEEKEKVIEKHSFEYSILNNNYYYRLAHMELVNKKNYLVAVDHENKTVSLAPGANLHKANKTFDIRNFKKILEKKQAHATITQLGEEKILTIDNIGDPDIQGYRIYYSPQNYRIHKMLIGMVRLSPLEDESDDQNTGEEKNNANEQADTNNEDGITSYYYYLEVLFTEVQPLELNEKDFNPENKIIQVNNGSVSLTPAFKEYQVLNHKLLYD